MALSKITNGGVAPSGIPSGGVIQVKQAVKTDRQDIVTSGSTASAVTGLLWLSRQQHKQQDILHSAFELWFTNYNGMSSFLFRDNKVILCRC